MGSLMAGWDSPVDDPRTVNLERNKSMTNEKIEAYWRSKKKDHEEEKENIRAVSDMPMNKSNIEGNKANNGDDEEEGKSQRSSSLPLADTKDGQLEMETVDTSFVQLVKKNGWWTRCSSAFLNEPPVNSSEVPAYKKYASQFHLAGMTNPNPHGTPPLPLE